jgi:hypothetical protein
MSNVGLRTNIRNEFAFISRFRLPLVTFGIVEGGGGENGDGLHGNRFLARSPMAAIGNRRVAERNSFQGRKTLTLNALRNSRTGSHVLEKRGVSGTRTEHKAKRNKFYKWTHALYQKYSHSLTVVPMIFRFFK